jgi:hypothetical protein
LNGSVFDHPIAAFRVIPYLARKSITLPDLDKFLDIPSDRLQEMKSSDVANPDDDLAIEEQSIANKGNEDSNHNSLPDDLSNDE